MNNFNEDKSIVASSGENLKIDLSDFLSKSNKNLSATELLNFFEFVIAKAKTNISNNENPTTGAGGIIQTNAHQKQKETNLVWHGNKPLDLFIDDLVHTFPGVKPKKNLYKLFRNSESGNTVEVPPKHLPGILVLFYELHKQAAIKVKGNRGLFKLLSTRFVAPSGMELPRRDFRKIRNETTNNSSSISEINKLLSPILARHCSKKKDK